MKKWDEDWIHFSKRTRRGIFVLLILFVIISVSPRLYYNYFASVPEFNTHVTSLSDDKDDPIDQVKTEKSNYIQPNESFDPNQYSLEEWKAVGLSQKQAQSILNYLNTGAQFRIKTDLKKLYVIDSNLYELLKPKMNLPDSFTSNDVPKDENDKFISNERNTLYQKNQSRFLEQSKNEKREPIMINLASKKELENVPGIGPFFADEIIKMRNDFGGIINADELLEIYNMDKEKLDNILPFLIIDKEHVNRMNINLATEQELAKHPFISSEMAHSIVYFRKKYKKYESLDELLLSPYIDSKILKKLKPYLKVE